MKPNFFWKIMQGVSVCFNCLVTFWSTPGRLCLSGTRAKGAWHVIAATPHEHAVAAKRNLSC